MHIIAQGFPITSQSVDKFLSLDPLQLALIVIVIVVAVDFIKSWFRGRSTSSEDRRQDVLLRAFTDEKSPMVQSSNRVAAAIEQSNKRSEEQTAASISLSQKTDMQTSEVKTLIGKTEEQTIVLRDFTNFQKTNNDQIADLTTKVDDTNTRLQALERNVAALNTTVQGFPQCEEFTKQLEEWKVEIITAVKGNAKHATSEQATVVTPPANVHSDTPPAGAQEAA